MNKNNKEKTVDEKQKEIEGKVAKAKEKVIGTATKINRAELKTKTKAEKKEKPADTRSWLERYIEKPESSGAKLVTSMLVKGCTLEEASVKALEFGKGKSSWGTKSNIKSQLSYLKSKGCTVEEQGEGNTTIYKVSQ